MFTGLIQKVGRIAHINTSLSGATIEVEHDPWDEPLTKGESVAVQGACLTVAGSQSERFTCDILRETLDRTSLGNSRSGASVNLERALRPCDRSGRNNEQ